ncbi:hypothetical protein QJ48_16145 [Paenibacillus sp. A3]|uniref:hypothetical protein n=1 Tax=Paenibacillus TaxID=44249 RepID=UPI0006D54D11|nr:MULTISPECIES: hypothetical protein [Paenibacillus]KPV58511.1 hypothetical protein QJ48_16145 [Paenibacillus sp. A3]MEC0208155.1 hypothetical protein [Paenibacillus ehimensis]
MKNSSYNPFNDETLHSTVNQTQSNSLDERVPYNDVIKHGDIVQGFQAPKRLEQFPKWYQNPRRIYATISVLGFASFMIYQIIQIITAIAFGK